jgi:hypothetical protein
MGRVGYDGIFRRDTYNNQGRFDSKFEIVNFQDRGYRVWIFQKCWWV